MYINLHTHQSIAGTETAIVSFYENFERVTANGFFSIGIHPCFSHLAGLDELVQWSNHANVIAVGECGLDKQCNSEFALQKKLFTEQIQLAGRVNRPLIIHCVKAFDEVIQLLQAEQCKVPVIFHGFNKSKELALQLTAKGYYLSFGKALEHERMQEVLKAIPASQFFLETDMADVRIETVYGWAAHARQIELNSLSLQLQKNAQTVFGENFLNNDN